MKKFNKKILFIVHGKKNKARKLESQLLKLPLPEFQLLKSTHPRQAIELAYDNCHLYSHVVAVGGDGTLHEVINGIMDRIGDDEGPVISLLPAGTANDFAKTIRFPVTIAAFYNALKANQQVLCDLGRIRYTSAEGVEKKSWFINIADAGIGPAVVEELDNQPALLGANITFFRAILKTFRLYRNIPVHCKADDWEWEGHIKTFAVANGKYFGSGLMIAPHARIDDGNFAITIGADINTSDYIKNLPMLKQGKKIIHPQVFYKETRSLKLTSPRRCPIEADGELIGFTPAEFTILKRRLRFLICP